MVLLSQCGKEQAAHTVSPSRALTPAGAVPNGCHWSKMLSLSEGPALSLIWVDERPSLPVHAQSPGLKASPMATLSIPQGQRGFAHSHPPLPRQSLSPPPLATNRRGRGMPKPAPLCWGCLVNGAAQAWWVPLSPCGLGDRAACAVARGSALQTPTNKQQGGNCLHWEHHPEAWIFSSL